MTEMGAAVGSGPACDCRIRRGQTQPAQFGVRLNQRSQTAPEWLRPPRGVGWGGAGDFGFLIAWFGFFYHYYYVIVYDYDYYYYYYA